MQKKRKPAPLDPVTLDLSATLEAFKANKRKPAPPSPPAAAPEAQIEPAEVPEWVDWTPEIASSPYHLMVEGPDQWAQDIELQRDEYIQLKANLAALRGYARKEA